MIVLVPISPEVPKRSQPANIPGIIFMIILAVCFLEFKSFIEKDRIYVEGVISIAKERLASGESIKAT